MGQVTAYILMVTEVGKEHAIADRLRELKALVEAAPVYGEYDLLAKFKVSDLRSLDQVVTEVRNIEGVVRTITLISS